MRAFISFTGAAALIAGLVAAAPAPPPAADTTLMLQPESRVWFDGTSTVRDFTCAATQVEGSVEIDLDNGPVLGSLDAVSAGGLDIPVAALDCDNGTMNKHMRKALKATTQPVIRFALDPASVSVAPSGRIRAAGTLEIAGKSNAIVFEAVATDIGNGGLGLQGSVPVRMTDYGVKPPSLMLGTMKVRPDVVVHFDLLIRR